MKNSLLLGLLFGSTGVLSWFFALILDKTIPCTVTVGACHPFLNNYIGFFKQIFIIPFGLVGVLVGTFVLWSIVGIILSFIFANFITNHKKLLVTITVIIVILILIASAILDNVSNSYIKSQSNREGFLKMGPDGTFIYTNGQWIKQ